MKKLLLYIAVMMTAGLTAAAGDAADSATVHFHQSHTALLYDYSGNGAALDRLAAELADTTLRLSPHIRVIGSASPEGTVRFNRYLSEQRARRIYDYFASRSLASDSVHFVYTGRNWAGLRTMVEADSAVPCRDEVLAVLGNIIDGKYDDTAAMTRLRAIGGGQPYLYMYHHLFPALRAATIYVDFASPLVPVSVPAGMPTVHYPRFGSPEPGTPLAVALPAPKKPFYMALKTNMLFDALALPNIGAEFYLGRNWSAQAQWTYGWWDNDPLHRYWRAYGGEVGLRRWFGSKAAEKPLTGHHVGLYAGIITYDFEFGGSGIMGGKPGGTLWDRCNRYAGIEYGYSLPVGRRINIDFTVGFGYLGGKYLKYDPMGSSYVWKSTHRLNWFGPTKAEVSLVWLIGRGNYNQRK